MITLEGYYYDGRHPISVPAKMEFADKESVLTSGENSIRYANDTLKVSPRIGKADRFITLPSGGQFQCANHTFLDSLPQISPSEGPVAWLEERWGIALAGVAIIACTLLAGYFFGLPAAAERIAARIPIETEQTLGSQAVTWLDKRGWFKPTKLDLNTQTSIREGFNKLRSDLPLKDYCQLEFRDSKIIGANAFALPGGKIVITDDMVKTAETTEEVLAVLAHEIGHVELRHTMRSLLQNSAVAAVVSAVTSDAASLSVAVAGLPVLVAQTKYSREFETAADDFSFKLLKQKGYSPAAFATIMERLGKKKNQEESTFSFVSTHPITAERVQSALDAAGSAPQGVRSDDLNAGYEAAKRGDNDEAIRLYTKAITSGGLISGKQAMAFNNRGSSWMNKKDYDHAIADYNEAIRLDPQFAAAYVNRGDAWRDKKDYDSAIADYDEAIRLDPQFADAYVSRGNAWVAKKDYDRVFADYNEAIRLNPQFAMALSNRGIAHFYQGQFILAAADLKQSQQLSADIYTAIWLYLARARSGDNEAKSELAVNTNGIKPDWPKPVVALYLGNSSPVAIAAAAYHTDQKTHKEHMCEANFYLGEWHLIKGEKEQARSLLSKAESECPQDFQEYTGAVMELKRLK